jgi:hypothetical protein
MSNSPTKYINSSDLHIIIIIICYHHYIGYLQLYTRNKTFKLRKPVHHYTIEINQSTKYNSFTSLWLDVYVWLNVFRAPPPQNQERTNSLADLQNNISYGNR